MIFLILQATRSARLSLVRTKGYVDMCEEGRSSIRVDQNHRLHDTLNNHRKACGISGKVFPKVLRSREWQWCLL
jgi:hypothetical protein